MYSNYKMRNNLNLLSYIDPRTASEKKSGLAIYAGQPLCHSDKSSGMTLEIRLPHYRHMLVARRFGGAARGTEWGNTSRDGSARVGSSKARRGCAMRRVFLGVNHHWLRFGPHSAAGTSSFTYAATTMTCGHGHMNLRLDQIHLHRLPHSPAPVAEQVAPLTTLPCTACTSPCSGRISTCTGGHFCLHL